MLYIGFSKHASDLATTKTQYLLNFLYLKLVTYNSHTFIMYYDLTLTIPAPSCNRRAIGLLPLHYLTMLYITCALCSMLVSSGKSRSKSSAIKEVKQQTRNTHNTDKLYESVCPWNASGHYSGIIWQIIQKYNWNYERCAWEPMFICIILK